MSVERFRFGDRVRVVMLPITRPVGTIVGAYPGSRLPIEVKLDDAMFDEPYRFDPHELELLAPDAVGNGASDATGHDDVDVV